MVWRIFSIRLYLCAGKFSFVYYFLFTAFRSTLCFLISLYIQQLVIEAYLRDGSSIAIGTPSATGSVELRRRLDDVASYRWPPPEWDIVAAHGAQRRGGVIRQGENIAARQVAPFLRPSAVAARGRVDSGQRGGRGGGVPRGNVRQPHDDAAAAHHAAEIDALIAGGGGIPSGGGGIPTCGGWWRSSGC